MSKFTPFWACEFVRAISQYQMKWGFPNLDQNCILALLRSLFILGLIELDLHFIFNFKPVIFYQISRFLLFASFCIYLVRPWPVSVPHPTWLRTSIIVYVPWCQRGSRPWWDELYRVVALCMLLWLLILPFVLVGCGAGPRCIWCWLLLFLGCWCCWRIFHYCTL